MIIAHGRPKNRPWRRQEVVQFSGGAGGVKKSPAEAGQAVLSLRLDRSTQPGDWSSSVI